jgi:Domain of unknown function (DUF5979)
VDRSLTPDFTILAGAGSTSKTYPGLPPDVQCTVAESQDGAVSGVVTVTPSVTQPPPISSTGSVEADVTDDYTALVGSLTVTKTIAGPSAGTQGQVTIGVLCDGVPSSQTPTFVIDPGAPAGSTSHTYPGIPDGTKCVVSETADGETSTVAVTVAGENQTATVTAGTTTTVTITDTYTARPGTIIVPKTLAGPLAGTQGPVTISALCHGTALPNIVIPAGTAAGLQTEAFNDVPPGSTCTVTETADGATSTATVTTLPTNTQTVTVAAGAVVVVPFTNIYADSPATLTVTKNITGSAAGREGAIAMLVDCGEPVDQFAFLIPAGTPAGSLSRSFDNIPAGATCTVTETSTGASSAVSVAVTSTGNPAKVSPDQNQLVVFTDDYSPVAAPATTPQTLAVTGDSTPVPLMALLAAAVILAGTGLLLTASGRFRRRRRP